MNKKMAIFLTVLTAVALCPWSIVPRVAFLFVVVLLMYSVVLGANGIDQVILRSETLQVNGQDVYRNDLYVLFRGCKFSFVVQYNGIPVIFVDKHFLKLSPNTQWFVVLHELAHVKHGDCFTHYTMADRWSAVKEGKVLSMELLADKAAADVTGVEKAIEAMKELKTQMKGMAAVEFDLRIAALAAMS